MAQTAIDYRAATRGALDLHTDLSNVETYVRQGNVALVRELILAAETKMHAIEMHLHAMRAHAGMVGGGAIIDARAEG